MTDIAGAGEPPPPRSGHRLPPKGWLHGLDGDARQLVARQLCLYGFALQEASLPFDTADELADMVEDVYLPLLPPDEFPYLNESAAALVAARYDPAKEFIFGLDLVLAALEPLKASA